MSDFLEQMAKASAERAAVTGPFRDGDLDAAVVPLELGRFDVIAEIKDRSPADGELAVAGADRAARARAYAAGGAAAISVLTEPSRFAGSLKHLGDVVAAVPGTPVMRKDFLVDPVQVLEARNAGASGVLLIVTMLRDDTLSAMLDCAAEFDMFVLLEAFGRDDVARMTRLLDTAARRDSAERGRLLFGVNSRDLRTLEVDPGRLAALAAAMPEGRRVAESGLKDGADAARVAALGYSLALVGTALMKSDDPAELVRAMRDAGGARIAA